MTAEKLSLHRKLAQVMHEAERIPKNGRAPQVMGGYPFVQVGDAADYIRKALAAHLITMMPTNVQVVGQVDRQTKNGGTMTTVDLITTWTLTDGESGETIQIQSFGAGADGGDKYSGKASTSAMKYALLTGFLLSTGDDTEAHASPEQVPARPVERQSGIVATDAHPAESQDPYQESEELVGDFTGTGMVRLGTSDHYKLESRIDPDGRTIGFRMEFKDDANLPQVLVTGKAGEALFLACGHNPGALRDTRLRVSGRLFNVKSNRSRTSWKRLMVSGWEGHEYKYPADVDDAALPEPPDDVALPGETVPLGLAS